MILKPSHTMFKSVYSGVLSLVFAVAFAASASNFTVIAARSPRQLDLPGVDLPALWHAQNETYTTWFNMRVAAPELSRSMFESADAILHLAKLAKTSNIQGHSQIAPALQDVASGIMNFVGPFAVTMGVVDTTFESTITSHRQSRESGRRYPRTALVDAVANVLGAVRTERR
ncbi:hypothetical protein BDW22DRAFT_411850 [Trametopsis cervina]|nr:hypothetical protein BDW22DRAFT_411850 [Trametopsis cervina]